MEGDGEKNRQSKDLEKDSKSARTPLSGGRMRQHTVFVRVGISSQFSFLWSIDCKNVRWNNMAEVLGSTRLSRHLSIAAG